MIGNVSPCSDSVEQTLNTLRAAAAVRDFSRGTTTAAVAANGGGSQPQHHKMTPGVIATPRATSVLPGAGAPASARGERPSNLPAQARRHRRREGEPVGREPHRGGARRRARRPRARARRRDGAAAAARAGGAGVAAAPPGARAWRRRRRCPSRRCWRRSPRSTTARRRARPR